MFRSIRTYYKFSPFGPTRRDFTVRYLVCALRLALKHNAETLRKLNTENRWPFSANQNHEAYGLFFHAANSTRPALQYRELLLIHFLPSLWGC
jgi:hypothetical protein